MGADGVADATLWSKVTAAAPDFGSLSGIHETDIAIAGGGVAGLSLACHLGKAGMSPAVLEATMPGGDAAGKSAGIITSLSVRHSPYEILKKYGEEQGGRLVRLIGESGSCVFSLIRELGLDCAPQQTGFLGPARTPRELRRIERIASEWRSSGYGIQTLDRETIRRLSGLDAYRGALLDPNGGAVNPLAYVRELARAAAGQGARIFINSPVLGVYKNRGGWRLESDNGRVNAKKVVLCAGGGNRHLSAELAGTVLPFRVFQMATDPLEREIRELILPENHALTDVSPDIFSIRYDRDGRLITACPAFVFGNRSCRIVSFVEGRLRRFSSRLETARIRYLWKGTTWIGRSVLPRFMDLSGGLFAIQACNGRGLAVNTILGREVAEFIASSGRADNSNLALEKPDTIRCYRLMSRLPAILVNTARLRSRLLHAVTGLQRYN